MSPDNAPDNVTGPSPGGPAPGFVRLYTPTKSAHALVDGQQYNAVDGVIDVPRSGMRALIDSGGYSDRPFPAPPLPPAVIASEE